MQLNDHHFELIEVDMGRCSFLDANMCAPLGALLYKIGRNLNTIRLVNIPDPVKRILSKNGFLQAYGVSKALDTYGTTVEYHRFEPKDDRYFALYLQRHLVGKGIPIMSDGLQRRFREAILEIFSNAVIHSQTKLGIFSCGQAFPKRHLLDFSVADLGIGMRQNLRQKAGLELSADEAIRWATEGRNTTKTGKIPGGLGLKLLREFITHNGGKIQIVSDSGYWELAEGQVSTRQFSAPFPGTVVNIEINTSDTKSYCLASETNTDNIF
jgi:hypothetical protein